MSRCFDLGCAGCDECVDYAAEDTSEGHHHTFRRHSISLTRESSLHDWYIIVKHPSGGNLYDGWWRDSSDKTAKDALAEAKRGAMLKTAVPRG
jgi:hypothetical protein